MLHVKQGEPIKAKPINEIIDVVNGLNSADHNTKGVRGQIAEQNPDKNPLTPECLRPGAKPGYEEPAIPQTIKQLNSFHGVPKSMCVVIHDIMLNQERVVPVCEGIPVDSFHPVPIFTNGKKGKKFGVFVKHANGSSKVIGDDGEERWAMSRIFYRYAVAGWEDDPYGELTDFEKNTGVKVNFYPYWFVDDSPVEEANVHIFRQCESDMFLFDQVLSDCCWKSSSGGGGGGSSSSSSSGSGGSSSSGSSGSGGGGGGSESSSGSGGSESSSQSSSSISSSGCDRVYIETYPIDAKNITVIGSAIHDQYGFYVNRNNVSKITFYVPKKIGDKCYQITGSEGGLAGSLVEWEDDRYKVTLTLDASCTPVKMHILEVPCPGTSSSSSGSGGSGSGSSGSSSSSSSKTAILPIVKGGIDSKNEYIGVQCVETPDTWFMDFIEMELDDRGKGMRPADPTFCQIIEPGTLSVVSAIDNEGCPVRAKAKGYIIQGTALFPGFNPKSCTIQVKAKRIGHTERFPQFSEGQYKTNEAFYASAHKE